MYRLFGKIWCTDEQELSELFRFSIHAFLYQEQKRLGLYLNESVA